MKRALMFFLLASLAGCTVINTVQLPSDRSGKDVFVTAGDISEPHEVISQVQVTRSGLLLFGFVDVVGTDLEAGFKEVLIPEIRRLGGDGAVRTRWHMTQYTTATRVVGLIFFFVPLPSTVTITAQVVKLGGTGSGPAVAPPAAPGTTNL